MPWGGLAGNSDFFSPSTRVLFKQAFTIAGISVLSDGKKFHPPNKTKTALSSKLVPVQIMLFLHQILHYLREKNQTCQTIKIDTKLSVGVTSHASVSTVLVNPRTKKEPRTNSVFPSDLFCFLSALGLFQQREKESEREGGRERAER